VEPPRGGEAHNNRETTQGWSVGGKERLAILLVEGDGILFHKLTWPGETSLKSPPSFLLGKLPGLELGSSGA